MTSVSSKNPGSENESVSHQVANSRAGLEPLCLYRLPEVLKRIPVSRSHWWAGVASGKFPKGIKLSERVTAWRSDDIQNLILSFE